MKDEHASTIMDGNNFQDITDSTRRLDNSLMWH